MFVRSDASLFRSLTTLGQKAGVPRDLIATLVLKELTDNALDAGAECKVSAGKDGWYYIEDDGPGIDGTDEEIASLFSFGRPLTSTKLFRLPTRGALGNGLRVVAGAVCASKGLLRVRTRGRCLELMPKDDGSTTFAHLYDRAGEGTRIEIKFGADLVRKGSDPLALATVSLTMRGTTQYSGKTSPWWYGSDDFYELLMAWSGTVRELLGLTMDGFPKLGSYYHKHQSNLLSRDDAASLLNDLRQATKEVKPEKLGLIGDIFNDINGYGKDKGYFELPDGHGEKARLPFVVEVWATREKPETEPTVQFLVNRTPITAKVDCWVNKARTGINGCGLNHYVKTGRAPMNFIVNVQCPYMPITNDGKAPNFKPLAAEMFHAIESAARKARRTTSNGRAEVSKKDVVIDALPVAIKKASGNGKHRFSLRQLYYAVRPIFMDVTGTDELDYNHFATIITQYEQGLGHDIVGMYRDARGTLYHPHSGETIPLGTLNVERYKRPEWTFNKILYCEKEGFFPLLLDEKWAERHDCALLTSKGYASRAARDVIDLLGDSEEALYFFAIHDADGPGTGILEALKEATAARPARKVEIIDLGLNPWEATEMSLAVEHFKRKNDSRVPVAAYVRNYSGPGDSVDWEEWLQTRRVELNAMTSPAFLAWLDEKIATHDVGKVIPPNNVLKEKLAEATEKEVKELVEKKILEENNAEERVAKAFDRVPEMKMKELRETVQEALDETPEELWKAPLERIAAERAKPVVEKA